MDFILGLVIGFLLGKSKYSEIITNKVKTTYSKVKTELKKITKGK